MAVNFTYYHPAPFNFSPQQFDILIYGVIWSDITAQFMRHNGYGV